MRKKISKLELLLAIVALAFHILCLAGVAFAGPREVAATAPLAPLKPEKHNGDYLREAKAPPVEAPISATIFDKKIADEMKQKFNAYHRDFEAREPYQLNEMHDYLRYQQSSRELADWTMRKLIQYHIEHTLIKEGLEKSVRRAAQSKSAGGGTQSAAKAVVAITQVHKALRNTTINLGADTKTRFRYDFPSGTFTMGMTSPVVDANMDFRTRGTNQGVGTIERPERLSLGMSKNLEFLHAGANVRYGLLSERLNYGMSKHLVGPLSAQVDQARCMRDQIPGENNFAKVETMFRLNLGASF